MPAKKKVDKPLTEQSTTSAPTQDGERRELPVGGIAPEQADVLKGDIDSRMAALLRDHKEMGAR